MVMVLKFAHALRFSLFSKTIILYLDCLSVLHFNLNIDFIDAYEKLVLKLIQMKMIINNVINNNKINNIIINTCSKFNKKRKTEFVLTYCDDLISMILR